MYAEYEELSYINELESNIKDYLNTEEFKKRERTVINKKNEERYIYIISNAHYLMLNWYKIGISNDPNDTIIEFNRSHEIPMFVFAKFKIDFTEADIIESVIHDYLSWTRSNAGYIRLFFFENYFSEYFFLKK